jgi:hypothetical protein
MVMPYMEVGGVSAVGLWGVGGDHKGGGGGAATGHLQAGRGRTGRLLPAARARGWCRACAQLRWQRGPHCSTLQDGRLGAPRLVLSARASALPSHTAACWWVQGGQVPSRARQQEGRMVRCVSCSAAWCCAACLVLPPRHAPLVTCVLLCGSRCQGARGGRCAAAALLPHSRPLETSSSWTQHPARAQHPAHALSSCVLAASQSSLCGSVWMAGRGLGLSPAARAQPVQGGSLAHIMRYRYPDGLDEVVIATAMRQVLRGLEYVHRHEGIHRDVKVRAPLPHRGRSSARAR